MGALNEDSGRVSVSRDALRADLGDMRDELKDYIKGELDKKADSKTVDQLAQSMTLLADSHRKLMEGELNRAQRAAVQEQIDETLDARQEKGWSSKERRLATFAGAFGVMGVISSMTYTFHALGVI